MSWSGIKKNLGRTGTKFSQKIGTIEKTIDKEFEEEQRRFKSFESKTEKLHKETKGYLESLRAMNSAQVRISDTIEHFYEESSENAMIGKKYKEAFDILERDCKSCLVSFWIETVSEPIARLCSYFPHVNDNIKKREKKLLDSDAHRAKVQKLVYKSSSEDQTKLARAEEAANTARELYESLNNQLVNELPRFIDLRVPYIDPTFEALVKIQLKFCRENHDKLSSLQNYFPPNDSPVDSKVEEVLQKMRDLAICGMG
ncbi:2652_t:CDS:2 [Diversispora eburnea]|uniref:2652_t:CDS:1 n=1 Tax=Diversispora eburnea TaxID=1213867 RepID=A0A9N9EZ38_9GLOM|nr:2652_t:CDS:2 [Diversispora eburnea]